jgi:hypothetical protein
MHPLSGVVFERFLQVSSLRMCSVVWFGAECCVVWCCVVLCGVVWCGVEFVVWCGELGILVQRLVDGDINLRSVVRWGYVRVYNNRRTRSPASKQAAHRQLLT